MSVTVARRHCQQGTVSKINGVDDWHKVPLECGVITVVGVPSAGTESHDSIRARVLSWMKDRGLTSASKFNVNVAGYQYQYLIQRHMGKALLIDVYTGITTDNYEGLTYLAKAEHACRMGMVYVCIDWLAGVTSTLDDIMTAMVDYPHGTAIMIGFEQRFVSWSFLVLDDFNRILAQNNSTAPW